MSLFSPVDPKQKFPDLEQMILRFWQEEKIFEQVMQEKQGDTRPIFTLYEGPPTANGIPGIHHVLTRAFKDVIPRYKTMRGFRVLRKAGWDCHGLPVEVEVEKKLGMKGKPQIEEYGIAAFNQACKESVLRYINDWDKLTQRIAYWVDTRHAYRTLDNEYIESCWWLLKQLSKKNLLKQDYKVTKHCPRCGTSLAEAEASQGMKENIEDPAITVKLALLSTEHLHRLLHNDEPWENVNTSLLIWTTTPWTLPANVAAAVHPDALYAICEIRESDQKPIERVILLKSKVDTLLGKLLVRVVGVVSGNDLVGLHYQALYPNDTWLSQATFATVTPYVIIADQTVDPEEGTGIVHIAPTYGDLDVGKRHKLPMLQPVGLDGVFNYPTRPSLHGVFFKDADPIIIRELKERKSLFKQERIHHSYPFCWRCDSPLIYFAKTSWYVCTTMQKEEMIRANEMISWFPSHIKEGRFGDWLRNNVDWAISRERYWGTPIPVWQCTSCQTMTFVESVSELSQYIGRDITKDAQFDLHRPYIDSVSWPCTQSTCKGTFQRVKEVLDCWFDSGAMPYAQYHYPFENKEIFNKQFPADFICEGVDQTRGWFYTLHALSVLTQGQPAYRNCIVLGHILDEQGRKMSKRLGNIVDPWMVLNEEGADALRYYLYTASPPGQPRRFSQSLVRQGLRQFILTLWNCYSFFVTYAETEFDKLGKEHIPWNHRPHIDKWILGQLHRLVQKTGSLLDEYDMTSAVRGIADFVDGLSNWYVRRNRDRFWFRLEGEEGKIGSEREQSKRACYQTLYECLKTLSQLLAPFVPFVSEAIWQNLVRSIDKEATTSVHLSKWPAHDPLLIEQTEDLSKHMELVLAVVNLGRAARVEQNVKVRQPLQSVKIQSTKPSHVQWLQQFEREIKEELNVEEVEWVPSDLPLVQYTIRPNLPKLGKKYGPLLQGIKQVFTTANSADVYEWAQMVLKEQVISIVVSGTQVVLHPEEVLLSAESIPGFAAQAKDGLVVALRTEITEELRERGIARDLIRSIGELRKQANCNVSAHVRLSILCDTQEILTIITHQSAFIEQETLSRIQYTPLSTISAQGQVDIDGIHVQIMLDDAP